MCQVFVRELISCQGVFALMNDEILVGNRPHPHVSFLCRRVTNIYLMATEKEHALVHTLQSQVW